jgi:hypothetical protein
MISLEITPSASPDKLVVRISRQETQPRSFRNTLAILLIPATCVSHVEADVKVLRQMPREQQDDAAGRLRALTSYPAPVLEYVDTVRAQESLF